MTGSRAHAMEPTGLMPWISENWRTVLTLQSLDTMLLEDSNVSMAECCWTPNVNSLPGGVNKHVDIACC